MKPGDLIRFRWGFGDSITATGILLEINQFDENRTMGTGGSYVKYVVDIVTLDGRRETHDIWSSDNEPEVLSER